MSNTTAEIIEVCEALPPEKQAELADFARFLLAKQEDESFNGLTLSTSALGQDWNSPEEDAAWANL